MVKERFQMGLAEHAAMAADETLNSLKFEVTQNCRITSKFQMFSVLERRKLFVKPNTKLYIQHPRLLTAADLFSAVRSYGIHKVV